MTATPGRPTGSIPVPPRNRRKATLFTAVLLITFVAALVSLFAPHRLGLCRWPAVCAPLTGEDITQSRLDTALPAPQGDLILEQTFVPRRDGLSAVELLLVRYGGEAPPGDETQFTVELWDGERRVAVRSDAASRLVHNQPYRLAFPPLPDSAGRQYRLRLLGSEANHMSAWGYSTDVYDEGTLALSGDPEAPPLTARELRFATQYTLTAGEAFAAAVRPLLDQGDLLLAELFLLPLPGGWQGVVLRRWRACGSCCCSGRAAGTAGRGPARRWPSAWRRGRCSGIG